MRLISLKEVTDSMVLGKSLYSKNHRLMLGAGYRLTHAIVPKLKEKGVEYIYIMEEDTEEVIPEDIISDEVKNRAKTKLSEKAAELERFFQFKDISHSKLIYMLEHGHLQGVSITYDMKKVVNEILEDMATIGAKFLNSILFKSKDTYNLDHAINVTILSILIGKKYNFTRKELVDLGVGSFLHDFGKIVVEKMTRLSKSSAEILMKEHPTFGYLILKNSRGTSPIIAQIVNQHHEYQNGTGYPIGLTGDNLPPLGTVQRDTQGKIFRLAEICSVVNAYDNLVMNPVLNKFLSPSETMKELLLDTGTLYNKDIVNTLVSIIPHYPVGVLIKIKYIMDASLIGYSGVVVRNNPDHLNKPVIIILYDKSKKKIAPRMIDTSNLKHVEFEMVL